MRFPNPLVKGTLIKRYKRFLTDVELESGDVVTAHCANPGSMLGLTDPGLEVWLSPAANPERKLRYTWEMVHDGRALVGINTAHPNGLVAEAIEAGTITELQGYGSQRREVKYGRNSRIDILLKGDGPACYVEVKNVHLSRVPGTAEFPDSVTARGAKHLVEMTDMVAQGHRAIMVYLIQRGDCDHLSIAADIDPNYDEGLTRALESGVEAVAYSCKLTLEAITVENAVPLARP
ncbi:MAG: DNA/RNA nuclease SfsA [Alphaproteobacteria bacterium]|nr:DNA/RNA nuclease SfsA [Alphaproteobacteria bacterium]